MFNILIVTVGTIKESFWKLAINEYLKRLQPLAKIKIREVSEEKIDSVDNRQAILKKEAVRISKFLEENSVIVALDIRGKHYSSTEWAEQLTEWSQFGKSITFIIGGPLGLDAEVLKKSNSILSLSKMTFTHQMTRVILLEQIYRGSKILQGGTYHY
ncbi:23S rRNA (pseudouridine(1915)-N(3))-methyltransferase RlmH [Patescibacteria group bacterium]|nr:23S rRNA (pseudouridine(1915)-N(3))-methyltransferase RlmH [Patescibacteria group bacterium]